MTPTPSTARPDRRWGVYFRAGRRQPWTVIVHAGSEDAANRAMVALMGTRSGDWRVGLIEKSVADLFADAR
jgi:hypothetical protein